MHRSGLRNFIYLFTALVLSGASTSFAENAATSPSDQGTVQKCAVNGAITGGSAAGQSYLCKEGVLVRDDNHALARIYQGELAKKNPSLLTPTLKSNCGTLDEFNAWQNTEGARKQEYSVRNWQVFVPWLPESVPNLILKGLSPTSLSITIPKIKDYDCKIMNGALSITGTGFKCSSSYPYNFGVLPYTITCKGFTPGSSYQFQYNVNAVSGLSDGGASYILSKWSVAAFSKKKELPKLSAHS